MISKLSAPPMSEKFYDDLMKAFPKREVTPTDTIESIMYEAGKQYVITWVNTRLNKLMRIEKQKEVSVEPVEVDRSILGRIKRAWMVLIGRL